MPLKYEIKKVETIERKLIRATCEGCNCICTSWYVTIKAIRKFERNPTTVKILCEDCYTIFKENLKNIQWNKKN